MSIMSGSSTGRLPRPQSAGLTRHPSPRRASPSRALGQNPIAIQVGHRPLDRSTAADRLAQLAQETVDPGGRGRRLVAGNRGELLRCDGNRRPLTTIRVPRRGLCVDRRLARE